MFTEPRWQGGGREDGSTVGGNCSGIVRQVVPPSVVAMIPRLAWVLLVDTPKGTHAVSASRNKPSSNRAPPGRFLGCDVRPGPPPSVVRRMWVKSTPQPVTLLTMCIHVAGRSCWNDVGTRGCLAAVDDAEMEVITAPGAGGALDCSGFGTLRETNPAVAMRTSASGASPPSAHTTSRLTNDRRIHHPLPPVGRYGVNTGSLACRSGVCRHRGSPASTPALVGVAPRAR